MTYLPMLCLFLARKMRSFDAAMVHIAHHHADLTVAMARASGKASWVRVAASGPLGEITLSQRVAIVSRFYGLRHATRVQAMSREIAAEALAIGVNRERLVQIPNGVDVDTWRPVDADSRRAARRRLGLPEGRPMVLYAGRFAHQKGVTDLLDAWQRVNILESTLVLVGSLVSVGSIGSLAPLPRVIVRDRTENIAEYFQAADILVVPSRSSEGMSNVILEGMASGLPIIATRVGAASEMIRHQRSGVLVAPGSTAELAKAMTELLSQSGQREALGASARRSAERRYSIRSVVDAILAELLPLMAQQRQQRVGASCSSMDRTPRERE